MNERYRCRLDSYTDPNSAMISVRRHGIYFNSHTTILANLHNFKSITVDRDHENFDWCSKIYIKGSNERASTEYLAFTNDSRRKQNGRGPLYVPMKRIINQFSSLRYLALQKRELARIPVDYDSNTKELVAILSPQLEHECYKVEDLPKDPGIYSYLQGSEIVYYGRGKDIHNRGLEHKEKNWQFDSIKYSFVPDEQKRVFYENQFLEKYKSQNGTLPRYNLISGSSKFDKIMEAA